MTNPDFIKDEEITLSYPTWTFDPSTVSQSHDDEEGILRFPEEVEEFFREHGYSIFAQNMELFEGAEIDGKAAYISAGVQPIAILVDCFDEDTYFVGEEEVDYNVVVAGDKVLFPHDGVLIFVSNKDNFVRSLEDK